MDQGGAAVDREAGMNGTILIVEDEEKLSRLLADYLNQSGFETQWLAYNREYDASGSQQYTRQDEDRGFYNELLTSS